MMEDDVPQYYEADDQEDDYDYRYYSSPLSLPPQPHLNLGGEAEDGEQEGWWDGTPSRGFNFGFVVAILVVVVVQFQGQLLEWYRTRIRIIRGGEGEEMGSFSATARLLLDIGANLALMGVDYVRGFWYMGLEFCRNALFFVMSLLPVTAIIGTEGAGGDRMRDGRRAQDFQSLSSLPELEDCAPRSQKSNNSESGSVALESPGETDKTGGGTPRRRVRWNMNELEPAFLNEKDYPKGWMVYHPILGVVPKTVADRYDREKSVCVDAESSKSQAKRNENGNKSDDSTQNRGTVQKEEEDASNVAVELPTAAPGQQEESRENGESSGAAAELGTTPEQQQDGSLPVLRSVVAT